MILLVRRSPRRAEPSSSISYSSNHRLLGISPSSSAPASSLCRFATHMVETDEVLIVLYCTVLYVPFTGAVNSRAPLFSQSFVSHAQYDITFVKYDITFGPLFDTISQSGFNMTSAKQETST
jgi:hypothetical protein